MPDATLPTSSPVVTPSPAGLVPARLTHCPYRRATDLLQRLAPGKMRIGFFIGAGCPLAIRVPDGDKTKPLIPELVELTQQVKASLDTDSELKDVAKMAWSRLIGRGFPVPTIEDVLSHIRTLSSLCERGDIDGFSRESLLALDRTMCNHVLHLVSHALPASDTPYHILSSWIQAIPRDKPVEIFTTNYDLLLEQALEEQRVPYFDGFVGSDSAFLDLESMFEDDLPPRWARLWKIHGSINWWMTAKKKLRRSKDRVEGEQLLIYPSHLKYDQSRQMPFYAMLDRLRVFLRSDQCVLLTCGYSFGDEHINAYLAQGLSGNPNAACIGMIFGDRCNAPKGVDLARRHANLTLLASDGAVIGTVERDWHDTPLDHNPAFPIAVSRDCPSSRTAAPSDRCKWLLGDFAALGQFLNHQLSSRDVEQGIPDAP